MWLNPHTPPGRTALISDGAVLSYGELAARATRMARRLAALGVRPGSRVALLGANDVETVTAIHALMMLRAPLVALNTRLTPNELAPQLARTQPVLLLCAGPHAALAGALDAPVSHRFALIHSGHIGPDDIPLIERVPPAQSTPDIVEDPDGDAAILFTSGTSGAPKAAVLSRRSFDAAARASAERLGAQSDDVWLSVLPLFHIGGLNIVRRSAMYGTAIDLRARFEAGEIVDHLNAREARTTLMSVVPTMLHRLIEAGARAKPPFRLALLGGAAAAPELIHRAQSAGFPVACTYGLTEGCSQVATATPEQARHKPVSVGKALPGIHIDVRRDDGSSCAPGEAGEIVVRGPTLMRGYLDDPAATAVALRDGWLHTGDIGYRDDDGDLFVLQRRSDLIVSGGENVYPAEVEAVLRTHPAVADCAVVGLPSAEWGQRVAALLVARSVGAQEEQRRALEDIESYCRQRLAGYKLPRLLRWAAALPLNAAGKVDRQQVVAELSNA